MRSSRSRFLSFVFQFHSSLRNVRVEIWNSSSICTLSSSSLFSEHHQLLDPSHRIFWVYFISSSIKTPDEWIIFIPQRSGRGINSMWELKSMKFKEFSIRSGVRNGYQSWCWGWCVVELKESRESQVEALLRGSKFIERKYLWLESLNLKSFHASCFFYILQNAQIYISQLVGNEGKKNIE